MKEMTVTVTQFRKELFQLAKKSIEGERVSFIWQGVVFSVTPENKDALVDYLSKRYPYRPRK